MAARRKTGRKSLKKKAGVAASPLRRALAERDEALRFQAATAEILASLSRSSTDARPVFEAIVANVLKLFRTRYAAVFAVKGEELHLAASQGDARLEMRRAPAFEKFRASFPQRIDWEGFTGRALRRGRVSQIAPIIGNPKATPQAVQLAKDFGYDAMLVAPLMREGKAIGAIGTTRPEGEPFDARQLALFEAFAAQAVIAIENARLFNETKEALDHQKASGEILRVISGSMEDASPVFEAIVRSAVRLFPPCNAGIFMRNGEMVELRAADGPGVDREVRKEVAKLYPIPFNPATHMSARSMLERRLMACEDTEGPDVSEAARSVARAGKFRSFTMVPLVREDEGIGAISITHPEPGHRLSEKQLSLLRTFADQAVIAIENARLFNETKEALERQTATAEILRVIAGTPTDTQPVFEAIVQAMHRLIPSSRAGVMLRRGDKFVAVAFSGGGFKEIPERMRALPLDRSANYPSRAILDGEVVHVREWHAADAPPFEKKLSEHFGVRSGVIMPLLRKGEGVGALSVARDTPGSYDEKEIALLRSFADQAVIAIENARLFNETEEALERQTATSEILKVIAGSPADVKPVFDAILRSAVTLCGAELAAVFPFDGKLVHMTATHNWPQAALDYFSKVYPSPPNPHLLSGRTILSRGVVQIPDASVDEHYDPGSAATGHWRRMIGVPMLREGRPLGAMVVAWRDPGEAPPGQVELLQTFADQAAIAVENVRLFNETKEALEKQTATAEILRVISSTPTDTAPVFEAIVRNATRLCDAAYANVFRFDGERIHWAASYGWPDGLLEQLKRSYPAAPDRSRVVGRVILDGADVGIEDTHADAEYDKELGTALRYRRILGVPLMREGRAIGVLTVGWAEPGPIVQRHEDLLRTFAAQAVIAIENVRLFNETKEALEQQKASSDVLSAISSSIADTRPVFNKILESCERLFAGKQVGINLVGEDGGIYIGAYQGPGREELERIAPFPAGDQSGSGAAIARARVMHYADARAEEVPPITRRGCAAIGVKAAIFAPMLWEGRGIGVIFVGRDFTGPFSDKEIALLKTFADQAVIAIQNARLFREIQEKSAQLEVANKHKSDFLANMSHELRTPLNAIIGFSEVLSERMFGEVNEKQAEYLKDIHESGRHLLSLINDILDLSKIEAGRMELELSSFHLPNAISNAMTLVRERAQRHGIQLGVEMDPRLGEFQADERKVKQILLNLLSNAVKFTPDGGKVDVVATLDTDKVEIAVRDTGIGIAPEDQAAVFEEFKQVGRDYTRKAEGTGLGLALTKRLVELHGGDIALESAPGKGSTFTVRLPVR